ncbi:pyroglutamyl-peptidase I [Brevibacterium salitolerans]|uniref:pyroglutamyl-peptidase I family protein n=1 Tax=Brevibacterium salitolerans TaxID=1403566 RepID=UPI0031DA228E
MTSHSPGPGAAAASGRPRVLVTGFEPFGGDPGNPSEHAVRALGTQLDDLADLTAEILPVEYARAQARLRELMAETSPAVIVCVGLAGGRAEITPERIAVNLAEARIPDNAGAQPIDEPLVAGAPPARFSTLPVAAMAEAVRAAGVPAAVSYSAGTFVCNAVMFAALDAAAAIGASGSPAPIAGFVHVPRAAEDGGSPAGGAAEEHALPQHLIDAGVLAAVRAAVDHAGRSPMAGAARGAVGAED